MQKSIKKRLKAYKHYTNLIKAKIDDIAQIKALAEKCTYVLSEPIQTAGKTKDDVYILFADEKENLKKDIHKLMQRKRAVMRLIESVDNELYISILTMLYINCWSYKRIEREIGYCESYCKELSKKAIIKLSEKKERC